MEVRLEAQCKWSIRTQPFFYNMRCCIAVMTSISHRMMDRIESNRIESTTDEDVCMVSKS